MKIPTRVLAPALALVAGAIGAAVLVQTGPSIESRERPAPIPLVRAVTAQPQDYEHRVVTHGTVEPRTESELVAEVSGRIEWLAPSFVSGGFFGAEEALVRIEAGDYRTALTRSQASVSRARSELARARKELERQQRLAADNVASDSRLDDAENAEKIASAVQVEARANLEQAQRDLARTELSAPFDGRVRKEKVDVGQFVSRGTSLATVYSVDFAEVRLPVPDSELAYLELPHLYQSDAPDTPGPEVELRADFAGGRHAWRGRVVRTEGEIDPRTRMVYVVAQVEKPYARSESQRPPLAAGLFVEAEIGGRIDRQVVVLPRSALREGGRVLVVDAESRLRWRSVEVIRVTRQHAIVSTGLDAGERVCISTLESAMDGMQVRVEETAAPSGAGS
ncbi:MAG: efflux RND transporter periplasmic adaptor subunit [Deltaproteobacteria bacterium]|nr:efflux RND transporter periplasmic adaptor subunit [Deltaproteobacteria bacterium]MBW2360825.1 efflux RND transporter periplasmic adaptor subunit [Deltaproteobacteria bacterium]